MSVSDLDTAVGTAVQLAYEYEDVGCEHMSDMFNTFQECGEPEPCDFGTFEDMVAQALKCRKDGLDFEAAEKKLSDYWR